jgi:hypothetical protein
MFVCLPPLHFDTLTSQSTKEFGQLTDRSINRIIREAQIDCGRTTPAFFSLANRFAFTGESKPINTFNEESNK